MTAARSSTSALSDRTGYGLDGDIVYLDAAAYGPLGPGARDAALEALAIRSRPWLIDKAEIGRQGERLRTELATLTGVGGDDIALVGSVGHAAALAANLLPVASGERILLMEGEHPSNRLAWIDLAQRTGALLEFVKSNATGDWTSAFADAIDRSGAAPVAIAAPSLVHWCDGGMIDLALVSPLVRRAGGTIFADATHAVGAAPTRFDPALIDCAAFPLFKWMMGPYGLAAFYAAPAWQGGAPLDPNATNSQLTPSLDRAGWARGARRYDRGERDDPVALAMALAAARDILTIGPDAIAAHLGTLNDQLAQEIDRRSFSVIPARNRESNILSLRPADPNRAAACAAGLAERGVRVSERAGLLRVSPHLYNDAGDVLRFLEALASVIKG